MYEPYDTHEFERDMMLSASLAAQRIEPPKVTPADCEEIIQQAEREGKFLYEMTNAVVFSPKELRRLQAEGRFLWSPYNFELIIPGSAKDQAASGYR